MSDQKNYHFATQAIHAGPNPDTQHGSPQVPIAQSVSFRFPTAQSASDRFNLKEFGQVYSRLTNPTVDALEARLTALEGGIGGIAAASGHAAQMLAFMPLVAPGQHIVGSKRLYGGSTSQLTNTFPPHFGWESTLVDPDNPDNFKAAITEKTRAIFLESVANPGGAVVDIEKVARIAQAHHIPLIVDNTIPTPYLLKPLDWGANIVCYSTTKFICGNGTALGGAVIDGGNFDWGKDDRYPFLTGPCKAYNGMKFFEHFGKMAYFVYTKAVGLREAGPTQQPMNAFLTLLGLETLHVRMPRHVQNAQGVAEWLAKHPQVSSVSYAGLPDSPYHALAKKYTPEGPGALFSFDIKGDIEASKRFLEALQLFSFVANLGDTRSLIIHPASTTHSQLSADELSIAGVTPDFIRLSVGLEDIDDILWDLDQALAAATK